MEVSAAKKTARQQDISQQALEKAIVDTFMPMFRDLRDRVGTLEHENTILRGHVQRLTKRAE